MKILAIDDEKSALNVLVQAVKEVLPQAELHAFTDVGRAMQMAEQVSFDVAFLDIELGEVSGISVARRLKQRNLQINLIFVTGYVEYAHQVIPLHPSDYLLKPVTPKKVQAALDNLLYTPQIPADRITALTFGNFDLFVDGEPVAFDRAKSKELLAYLIDRKGCGATKREIAAILFEDTGYTRKVQNYITKIVSDLLKSLKSVGAESILIKRWNWYGVDVSKFSCDAYDYDNGSPGAYNAFHGEYMSQYSWAENSAGRFYFEESRYVQDALSKMQQNTE